MHALTAGMCAAALLAFGVAKAGEDRAAPAGLTVLDPDARIPSTQRVSGFEMVDDEHMLIRVGVRDLYLAELSGHCGHDARSGAAISIEAAPPGGIDRFAHVTAAGHRCAMLSLAKVERAPGAGHT